MIRLKKLVAEAGLGSRRTIEEWTRAGLAETLVIERFETA